MAISYAKFKRIFGDLGITEWVKFNWFSNAGIARNIYNTVVEAGYNPLAYVNNELYNRIEGEKFLVLVGRYTFTGNENWTISSTYAYITGIPTNGKKRGRVRSDADIPSYITLKELDGSSAIIIVTYSSENKPTLLELLSIFSSGKIFDYELATPILIDV